jgi:hypothetical protein
MKKAVYYLHDIFFVIVNPGLPRRKRLAMTENPKQFIMTKEIKQPKAIQRIK